MFMLQIFQLERDLLEAQKAAGLPPVVPKEPALRPDLALPTTTAPSQPPRHVRPPLAADELSESESESPEISPGSGFSPTIFF